MDKTTILSICQGALISLQIINAGIGTVTHSPLIVLVVGAVFGGAQYTIQHIGNNTVPTPPPADPPKAP